MSNVYSFKANDEQINKILNFFPPEAFCEAKDYMTHQIKYDDVVISIYSSKKVVLAGKNSSFYYDIFNQSNNIVLPQAGSDEVGTGDFFGPICVCASYVDQKIYDEIKQLNLTDSKQLTDQYMRKIAPTLINKVPHSLLILDNHKFNKVVKDNNMNAIKAKMHNACYLNLAKKGITLPQLCMVDDFCGESLYYRYNRLEKEVFKGLTFETKAESKYLSVAISSIIARYSFLLYFDELEKKYNVTFPKGAGNIVDVFAQDFVNKYGLEELQKVAKCNFSNYKKLL